MRELRWRPQNLQGTHRLFGSWRWVGCLGVVAPMCLLPTVLAYLPPHTLASQCELLSCCVSRRTAAATTAELRSTTVSLRWAQPDRTWMVSCLLLALHWTPARNCKTCSGCPVQAARLRRLLCRLPAADYDPRTNTCVLLDGIIDC